MKVTLFTLSLLGTALAAPTRTIENRQLGDLSSLGTSSGFGSLSSLFPIPSGIPGLGGLGGLGNLFGSGSSSSSSSSAGIPGLGGLENLFGSGSIPDFSSLLSGLGGSSGGLSNLLGGLGGSGGGGGLGSLLGGLGGSTGASTSDKSTSTSSTGSGSGLGSLSSLSSLMSGFGGSSTANGVTDKDACQPLTFIFARGTTELGNMGNVVGPVVAEKLKSLTNNKVVVQGVDYPASAAGNAAMGAEGGPKMAELVQQALKQCPKTKVVLGGYSQGAMVVHNAARKLSSGQVSGAVLFGDPFRSQAVANLDSSKVKEFCAQGDPVCLNGGNVMAHITYGSNAEEAAQFLVKAAGVGGN